MSVQLLLPRTEYTYLVLLLLPGTPVDVAILDSRASHLSALLVRLCKSCFVFMVTLYRCVRHKACSHVLAVLLAVFVVLW
jgi:hypothetical protein